MLHRRHGMEISATCHVSVFAVEIPWKKELELRQNFDTRCAPNSLFLGIVLPFIRLLIAVVTSY